MNELVLFSGIFVLSVLISSVSQVMLKKSANKTYDSKIKEYLNPLVIIAYVMFFGATLITMYAYKVVPLSFGPILESAGYIFVAVLGYIVLKERLAGKQILGMALILAGIALFSLGKYIPIG